ncbi:ABC transporter substrate-binding protein [Herbaspirillum lusitanum]
MLTSGVASAAGNGGSNPEGAPVNSIRIGEIDSQNGQALAGQAYRNGVALALAELNGAGGIDGRPLELVVRADDGSPDDAVRNARELIQKEKVDVLTGSMLSNVALAVSRLAASQKTVFVVGDALSDAITLDRGNRYTFRVRPSTYMQAAMLAEQAAKLPGRRWAIIAPNYEYGQSAVSSFKLLLKQARPDVEFVAEQWPALGKLKAEDAVRLLKQSRPDAIFNATFGADLQQFVNEGSRQQLFGTVRVFSMASADALGAAGHGDLIRNWIAIGYPADQLATAEHQRFVGAYQKRYNEQPRLSAIFGYTSMMAIAAGLKKAGSTDSEALIVAMRGMTMDTPLGRIAFRSLDQQASMGAFIGTVSEKDGHAVMSNWQFLDGARYMPNAVYVRGRRPASAMK